MFVRVTLNVLSPHPSSSTSGDIAFNDNPFQILGHLIALLINVSWGSIITIYNVLFPIGHSSVLGILDTMHCVFSRVWNYVVSFNIYGSIFFTFFCSSYQIATWSNCLYKFQVTMRFVFIPILLFFLEFVFATYLIPYNNRLTHIWILTTS